MFQHLRPYLNEVKTVIIPDLGAITVTNPDTNETMFMTFLKHDDGKFAGYIAEQEGIDVESAKAKLSKAVEEIQSKLNAEGKASIPGLGNFILQDGEIDFAMTSGSESTETTPVAEETNIEETTTETSEPEPPAAPVEPEPVENTPVEETVEETPIQEEEPVTGETPAETEPESVEETPTPSMETNAPIEEVVELPEPETVPDSVPKEEIPSLPKEETPVIPLQTEVKEPDPEMNILQKEQLAASQKKLDDLKKAKEAKPVKKKRGAGFWMLLVLIALLIAGVTYVGMNYNEVKQHIPFLADSEPDKEETNDELAEMENLLDQGNESDENSEDFREEETNSDEETQVDEEEIAPETDNTPEPATPSTNNSSSNMPWHLIAGTFSVEANAQRLADNLRKEGFNPTIRQVGAMYLVSAKGFPTKEAAQAGKSELNSVAPKAWVYDWK